MSKLLATLVAAVFATVTLTPVAFAAKHEGDMKKDQKKAQVDKGTSAQGAVQKKDAKKAQDKKGAKKAEEKK
jgi:hypothetical protein